jgi:uncharacterized protein YeaO (DUF488 family)
MSRRVGVVGSRWPTKEGVRLVEQLVASLEVGDVVVSGAAPGIDTLAVRAAKRRGLEFKEHPANWYPKGDGVLDRGAGYKRNATIVLDSDIVHAIWDGYSNGTNNTVERARSVGKLGRVLTFERPLVLTARISSRDPDIYNVSRKSGVDVFAPSWNLLSPFLEKRKQGGELTDEDWEVYRLGYLDEMRSSYRANRPVWDELLARKRSVLTCYCTDHNRCHRTILARDILRKLGARFDGELDA